MKTKKEIEEDFFIEYILKDIDDTIHRNKVNIKKINKNVEELNERANNNIIKLKRLLGR